MVHRSKQDNHPFAPTTSRPEWIVMIANDGNNGEPVSVDALFDSFQSR
jgi:hypothetical protein